MNNLSWMFGVVLVIVLVNDVRGAVKRCYKCRSRGELGDCRNPFVNDLSIDGSTRRPTTRNPFSSNFNDDLFQRGSSSNSHGVEAVPCSSGWCAKVIEGKGTFKADEYGLATERMCLQRPPQDLRERCAMTVRGNQEVYMCFCQGDLCNGNLTHKPPSLLRLVLGLVGLSALLQRAFIA